MTTTPQFLNLDEIPTGGSGIEIQHKGVKHAMAELDVDGFIAQQKRAQEHEELVQKAATETDVSSEEAQTLEARAVEVIRDAVTAFFPTLPVGELPVTKLFLIFGWLNEMSQDVNAAASEGATDGQGNV